MAYWKGERVSQLMGGMLLGKEPQLSARLMARDRGKKLREGKNVGKNDDARQCEKC